MPHAFVYLNQEKSQQFVTDTVEQFKSKLRGELQAWIEASVLDDAGAVSSIVAHALDTNGVGMGVIELALDEGLV